MHVAYIHVICVLSAMWVVLIHHRLFNYGIAIHLLQAQTKDQLEIGAGESSALCMPQGAADHIINPKDNHISFHV
jgi:hypothetical protein